MEELCCLLGSGSKDESLGLRFGCRASLLSFTKKAKPTGLMERLLGVSCCLDLE
jgi:hypothetical protein